MNPTATDDRPQTDPEFQRELDWVDAFVTEEIGIGDVQEAFERMHHGDVLRSVVVL